jgi:hypothetical protein
VLADRRDHRLIPRVHRALGRRERGLHCGSGPYHRMPRGR